MHITLVLPVYNEEKNVKKVITSVKKIVNRIIVIDNNSSDNTFNIIKKINKLNLKHCYNLGKSNSLKTGCDLAIKLKTDVIAFMDSDGQHKGTDLKKLINTMKLKKVDCVIGYRDNSRMPIIRGIGTLLIKIKPNSHGILLFPPYLHTAYTRNGLKPLHQNIGRKLGNLERVS